MCSEGIGRPGQYETLSSAPVEAAAGPRLAIAFAAETPEGELRALLQETGARIVEGPSPRGIYTLALDADAPLEDVVARLRAHPGVRLAEPFGDDR